MPTIKHFMKTYSKIFLPIEKAKKIYPAVISSVLLSSIYLDASARSRIADTEISSVDGVPCFTISLAEERRNGQPLLGALSVADLTDKPATGMWSFLMTGGEKIPLSSKSCLLYGDLPKNAQAVEGMPAPELQAGRVYSIFLNGRPNDPSDPTYGYMGKFCIALKPDGGQQVIPIRSTTRAWIDEVCPTAP